MNNKNIKNKKSNKSKIKKKIITAIWACFGLFIVGCVIFFSLIANGKIGYMPPIQDLENPIDKYASEVISVDLQNMGTYSVEKNNRIYVNYNELSPSLIQALVATEDARYEKHSGIDFYALARAIVKTGILRQESGGGASTISQQLAKQLYSEHAATKLERILQKPIEWVIAVQLERYYTKQEIINMYLNQYDFLYNAVGIQSASWVYFGKQPKDLKLEEAATLVGMCKNAILYNPRRFPERSLGRRNVVLDLMAKHDYITKQEADSLKETPLVLDYKKVDHNEGIAPYFREQLRITMTAKKPVRKNYQSWQMQKFKEDSIAWETNPLFGWCNKNKKQNGENYKLSTDGLKIYTTIDSRMQKYAEEAVAEHVAGTLQTAFYKEKTNASTAPFSRDISKKDLEAIMAKAMKVSDRYYQHKNVDKLSEEEITKIFNTPVEMNLFSYNGIIDTLMTPIDSIRYMKMFLRTGMMAMDTHTGAIKAYVGGTNYHNFKYDMVSTGKRQVGSTAKPFLYSLAMESGITPCDEVFHEPQKLLTETGSVWAPKNGRAALNANVSVRWGLQLSDNWVTAALMKQLSPYAFANLVQSYGLKNPVDPVVSSCLGPFDASVSEMVSAYSTFANGGISVEPIMVTRIEDRDGNVIASFAPNMHEVISEKASYQMLSMLESVINNGTGYRVRRDHGMTVPMGGKTGTTQRNSDAWFMCFTPSLVGGCWVGGEERSIHFNRMSEGQGAAAALPVMGKFLKKVYSDNNLGYSQSEKFEVPAQYSNPCPPTTSLLDVNYSGGTMAEEFQ